MNFRVLSVLTLTIFGVALNVDASVQELQNAGFNQEAKKIEQCLNALDEFERLYGVYKRLDQRYALIVQDLIGPMDKAFLDRVKLQQLPMTRGMLQEIATAIISNQDRDEMIERISFLKNNLDRMITQLNAPRPERPWNLRSDASLFHWFFTYSLITSRSTLPTVSTKYPSPQKLSPQ